jgi:hypothetical protein
MVAMADRWRVECDVAKCEDARWDARRGARRARERDMVKASC